MGSVEDLKENMDPEEWQELVQGHQFLVLGIA
jgi:hypothetical protein